MPSTNSSNREWGAARAQSSTPPVSPKRGPAVWLGAHLAGRAGDVTLQFLNTSALRLSLGLSHQRFSKAEPPEATLDVETCEDSWLGWSCREGGWNGLGVPRDPSPSAQSL
uniref:Uncharacterized protein n=1 Tax=Prolemur simus TaxID=1328070 RepID=A0A8C8ZGU7_PROSS